MIGPAESAAVRRPIGPTVRLMKRCYGDGRVRYPGLRRNALQLRLLCIASNLRHAIVLTG
jgi:IS5 family transposase